MRVEGDARFVGHIVAAAHLPEAGEARAGLEVVYASPLSVTPFAFQTAVNLNLWSKPEVWDANRNFTTGRF